jgi:hypothetical protein
VGRPLRIPKNNPPEFRTERGDLLMAFVPRGLQYEKCSSKDSQLRVICEEGVPAWDEEDGSVTAKVLSCPPKSCLPFGCIGHSFIEKGSLPALWL